MERPKTDEATLNIQSWVNTRLVAGVLNAMTARNIYIQSWSDVVRWAFEQFSLDAPETVSESLEIIASHHLSLNQLKRRGDGIRRALKQEDELGIVPGRNDKYKELALELQQSLKEASDENGTCDD